MKLLIPSAVQEWATKNAGRRISARFNEDMPGWKDRVFIGKIVGFGPTALTICVDEDGRNTGNVGYTWFEPFDENKEYRYLSMMYDWDITFLNDTLVKPQKTISNYPHQCPKCKGPAYIGFLTTVDCERKCS